MTEQNTLDEQIDRALALIEMERIYPGAHSYKLVGIEAAKQQLKTLFTKHSKELDRLARIDELSKVHTVFYDGNFSNIKDHPNH